MSTVIRAAVSFLQIAILARLLEPTDFGLIAMVAVFVSFANIFIDLGVSNAIIHFRDIGPESLSSLYWLNVLSGATLTVALIAASPLVTWFYGEPRLEPLLRLLSLVFVVNAGSQQLRVVAEKEFRFRDLAKVEASAAVAGLVAAVTAAVLGAGVYALVAGQLTSAVTSNILAWVILSRGWRPMLRFRFKEVRRFLRFGSYVVGGNVFGTMNAQVDVLIGGRVLGAGPMGFYSLPQQLTGRLFALINPIVTRVGLPVISAIQEEEERVRFVYLRTIAMIAAVVFPLYMMALFFANEVVVVAFGTGWKPSVILLQLCAVRGMFTAVGNPVGNLLYGKGRADLGFKWNGALVLLYPVVVWFGSRHGVEGLAWSVLALTALLYVPAWWYLVRPTCGAGLAEYSRQLVRPLLISVVSVGAAYGATWPLSGAFLRLGVGSALAVPLYLVLSHVFNRSWTASMRELLSRSKPTLHSGTSSEDRDDEARVSSGAGSPSPPSRSP